MPINAHAPRPAGPDQPAQPAATPRRLRVAERLAATRPVRVTALLAAICIMSLADLHLTLEYVRTVGMSEGNPLARWIMQHGSAAGIVGWKLATVAVGCGILFATRRTRQSELATWGCCLALTWLTLQWDAYAEKVPQITSVIHEANPVKCTTWVRLDGPGF